MKSELTKLIIRYKKNKDKLLLESIYKKVAKILYKKAQFIFYRKFFKIKGRQFTIKNLGIFDFDDILQELNVELLNIIEKYNITKPFENYFYSVLWNWKPAFMNKRDFWQNLENVCGDINDNEQNFSKLLAVYPKKMSDQLNIENMFQKLSDDEKNVLKLLQKNPRLNQSQVADKLGVTQQRISQIYNDLKIKYKKNL